ncbi:MAG: hypothetical protein ACTHNU_11105 [Gaiellales bacterium]
MAGIVCAVVVLGWAAPASAAGMLARNPRWITLKVNSSGVALVSYYAGGHTFHSLAWGARNALAPNTSMRQVRFHINYSGGYGSFLGKGYWKRISRHNVCGQYTGPRLWHMVAACTAPNGTNWALQMWKADLRDDGWSPVGRQGADELFLSHWSGALPQLWFKAGWTYAGAPGGPFDLVYGQFTYLGKPVFGYSSTSRGAPTDGYGRLITLDTLNPPWDRGYRQAGGWWRQNSFLTHRPYGDFCAGVFRKIPPLPARTYPGRGQAYRVIANGPGVTPVVEWQGAPPGFYVPGVSNLFPTRNVRGPYSPALDSALNADLRQLDPTPSGPSSCYYTH